MRMEKNKKKIQTTKREVKYNFFSDFFLHATEQKKEEVLKEAARRANEDQMRVFEEARLKASVPCQSEKTITR